MLSCWTWEQLYRFWKTLMKKLLCFFVTIYLSVVLSSFICLLSVGTGVCTCATLNILPVLLVLHILIEIMNFVSPLYENISIVYVYNWYMPINSIPTNCNIWSFVDYPDYHILLLYSRFTINPLHPGVLG